MGSNNLLHNFGYVREIRNGSVVLKSIAVQHSFLNQRVNVSRYNKELENYLNWKLLGHWHHFFFYHCFGQQHFQLLNLVRVRVKFLVSVYPDCFSNHNYHPNIGICYLNPKPTLTGPLHLTNPNPNYKPNPNLTLTSY